MCAVQAADTVKTQAVQLASSRSQVTSGMAAQKAAEQVQAMLCTNALICCIADRVYAMSSLSRMPLSQQLQVQHSTAQHSTARHGTARHSAPQHSTAQHSTAQHSTAQHGTARHSTAWHSAPQHSMAWHGPLFAHTSVVDPSASAYAAFLSVQHQ